MSAVLVPVFRDAADELRVVLVVRGAGGVHAGQVALPGGKEEPTDDSLVDTALRETEEEIGLDRSRVEIVAELAPIDTRTTGIRVFPFVARVIPPRNWRLAPDEISEITTPPVRRLVEGSLRREMVLSFPSWAEPRPVECVVLDEGYVLWGLTLRLLDAVVPRILAGEWNF